MEVEMEGVISHGDMGLLTQSTVPGYSPELSVNRDSETLSSHCAPEQKMFDLNQTVSPVAGEEPHWCPDHQEKFLVPCQRFSASSPCSDAKFWIDVDLENLLCLLSFEEQRLPSVKLRFVSLEISNYLGGGGGLSQFGEPLSFFFSFFLRVLNHIQNIVGKSTDFGSQDSCSVGKTKTVNNFFNIRVLFKSQSH